MANLTEAETYDAGVYQIETVDPVQGGDAGVSNAPLKNLANRTKYLKAHVDALETQAGGLAPKESPVLTGSPTAPTQALGDSTTKVATDDFVQKTVGGRLSKSVAGSSNVTLTAVEAGNGILEFTGVLTGSISVIVPTSPTRDWLVKNATSGAFTLTVKTAAGSGVLVKQGCQTQVYTDGTNVLLDRTDFDNVALTGVPTAPTAALGTNTTQIATMEALQAAVANLINGSPGALDALNELAAAMGNDPNFATTITNALAGKAALAGADFTGAVFVPAGFLSKKPSGDANAGGNIVLEKSTNSTLAANVVAAMYNNLLQIFEGGGATRGFQIDLSTCEPAAGSVLALTTDKGAMKGFVASPTSITLTVAQLGSLVAFYSGTAGQQFDLPATTAVPIGKGYWFINQGSVPYTVKGDGAETIRRNGNSGFVDANTITVAPGDNVFIYNQGGAIWGVFGTLFADMPLLGVGQTWQDLTGSRAGGTTYTNTTGKPIAVGVSVGLGGVLSALVIEAQVSGVIVSNQRILSEAADTSQLSAEFVVPAGGTYIVYATGTGVTVSRWSELR